MAFIRTKEDFVCAHCKEAVRGTGYTNHCPKCLWSKHVDVQPGDRAEICGGMMEPIALEGSTPHYRIVHKCLSCEAVRRVSVLDTDDPAALIALSQKRAIMES